jgi:hypothetical protein
MHPGAPEISGEWKGTFNGHSEAESGPLSGSAHSDGTIQLNYLLQTFNGMPNYSGLLTYKLITEGGNLELNGPMPHDWSKPISFRKAEPINPVKISVPMYSYAFTSKADVKAVGKSDQVSIGKIVVTDVSDLLLATDTVAGAKFRWKMEYSDIGKAMTESKQPDKSGDVEFRKQPDGTWVVTQINM